MNKGIYRRNPKKMCDGCDHPVYAPSKNVNSKRVCKKCMKCATKYYKRKLSTNDMIDAWR